MDDKVYVLGINSAYHEPAACLIENGMVIAAVEEERFNRVRHGKPALIDNPHHLPYESINYCLNQAGISMDKVSKIGFSFSPKLRLEKNVDIEIDIIPGDWGSKDGEEKFCNLLMTIPDLLSKYYKTNLKDKFMWIPHHVCHAASAFYPSPYKEAAILAVDGIGEFFSITLAKGKGNRIETIKEVPYPNSLGFLWTKASRYLGLLVNGMGEYGAGKIMALASYGNPEKYYDTFRSFVHWDDKGNFSVDENILQFRSGSHSEYERLFGKARKPDKPIEQRHKDFAAALQKITNELMVSLANYLLKQTDYYNLCTAGGVGLNCVTNSYLLEHGPFKRIFVQPAANDMGTALGAALYIWHNVYNSKEKNIMKNVYLGPEYSNDEIGKALSDNKNIEYKKLNNIEKLCSHLLSHGLIIGWFQGRMEFGPRALGNRSILADPRRTSSYSKVSIEIKGREYFRPLAPSVLKEEANKWFVIPEGSDSNDFMLFNYYLRPEKIGLVPAITHIDDSARIQTVGKDTNERYYNLIKNFYEKTGVPILVNTSFNVKSPIVCTPQHAIDTFIKSDKIDILAIGDYLVIKKAAFDLDMITRSDLSLKTFFEHLR